MALVPQNFSRSLTASVANCTETEMPQFPPELLGKWGQWLFQLSLQRMGHSDGPFSAGEELQLSFSPHVNLLAFILPGTLQNSSGMWDTHSELGLEGDPVPLLVPAPLSQFWLFCPFWGDQRSKEVLSDQVSKRKPH